jgi:hypothetical protein
MAQAALPVMEGTSRYMLKSSPSLRPRLSTMYWKVWVWTASSKAWRRGTGGIRVGEVAVDGEDDVVGHQGFRRSEEAEVALDGAALVVGEAVGALPESDVGLHGDLGGHPVVVAAGERYFSQAQRTSAAAAG